MPAKKETKQTPKVDVFVVTEDCNVWFEHQFLELKKDQIVPPHLGEFLEDTGAPVKRK